MFSPFPMAWEVGYICSSQVQAQAQRDALHGRQACLCSRVEEPRRAILFTHGRGSSPVCRILLAWRPGSPCPQDSGSRPGHRGTRPVLQSPPLPPPSVPGENGTELGRKAAGGPGPVVSVGSPGEPDAASR